MLLSKATFGGVSVAAELHWLLFSLEADMVDRSQGKLLTQACGRIGAVLQLYGLGISSAGGVIWE